MKIYESLYFYPKYIRNILDVKNSVLKYTIEEKDLLLKNNLNTHNEKDQANIKKEIFKTFKMIDIFNPSLKTIEGDNIYKEIIEDLKSSIGFILPQFNDNQSMINKDDKVIYNS